MVLSHHRKAVAKAMRSFPSVLCDVFTERLFAGDALAVFPHH
jgi:hypothetical protein